MGTPVRSRPSTMAASTEKEKMKGEGDQAKRRLLGTCDESWGPQRFAGEADVRCRCSPLGCDRALRDQIDNVIDAALHELRAADLVSTNSMQAATARCIAEVEP